MIPIGFLQSGLQPFAIDARIPQLETAPPFSFSDNLPEPLFYQHFQSRLILQCYLTRFFEKTVRYLYGRLHMANHIAIDG